MTERFPRSRVGLGSNTLVPCVVDDEEEAFLIVEPHEMTCWGSPQRVQVLPVSVELRLMLSFRGR